MNNIRAKFEEIWPVPEGIYFANGEYYPYDGAHATDDIVAKCEELDARLDTFTRCHEMTFSKEELNLFRKWFEAMEDLSQEYQDKPDRDLYWKVMELLK